MSIEHSGPFIESALFSGARYSVFLVLCNYGDEWGECFPSHEAIGTAARCTRETALREVDYFERKGCVEILRGDARPEKVRRLAGRSNVYRVNLALIRAMYMLVSAVKEVMGRDPKKRYQAVRRIAKWAEETIEIDGARAVVETASHIIANGDVRSLLEATKCDEASQMPESHSDERSLESGGESDIDAPKCDPPSHKPSSYPSEIEPSERAGARERPDGSPAPACEKAVAKTQAGPGAEGGATATAGAGGEGGGSGTKAGGEPSTLTEQAERTDREGDQTITERAEREAKLCVDFILGRSAQRSHYRWLWPTGTTPVEGRELGVYVEGLSWQGLSRAASWISWAEDLLAGTPGTVSPIRWVADLERAMRDAPPAEEKIEIAEGSLAKMLARETQKRCAHVKEACARSRAKAGVEPLASALLHHDPPSDAA